MPPKKPNLKPGANQGKKPPLTGAGPSASKAATPTPEPEKKPTPQEIIGGKSWTGKLPQALFHEYCVKAGWHSPSYSMTKEGNKGFIYSIRVRYKNPKTQNTEIVYFSPPVELPNGLPVDPSPYQSTALEALHYCATYALHRVSSMRNMKFMLPPKHKVFWETFEEIKKHEIDRKRAWMYEPDPFLTKREFEAANAKAERMRDSGETSKPAQKKEDKLKGWQNFPVVDMGNDKRRQVEKLVRERHVWNPAGIEMPKAIRTEVIGELAALGFRKAHVEEACEWTKDREEALEWLLIHVPEDDLPSAFLPGNYATGVTVSTILNIPLAHDYAAKRLYANGYSLDVCREALLLSHGNESLAAETLQHILLHGGPPTSPSPSSEDLISFADPSTNNWAEEQASLAAIWGPERYTRISESQFQVILSILPHDDNAVKLPPKLILEVHRPTLGGWAAEYPATIPVFSIIEEGTPRLPAHVKLSLIRQTAGFATALVGEMMLFSVVDWIESSLISIVADPGRLRDVSSAITGSDERCEVALRLDAKKKRGRPPKKEINWKPCEESQRLFRARQDRWETEEQKERIDARKRLPAWNLQEKIVSAVEASQVVIISGETGSGKSTQAVQFILDDMILHRVGHAANIICTQPRRISALGLADRVSEERCGIIGHEVGYAIRGDSRQKNGVTKITFVTTGVLLRRLQMGDGLEDVSHVFVDEVHERSLDTDFLLILLKRIIALRSDLKVVLMSATLDAEIFIEYFGGREKVQWVEIRGRTFPVEDYYLDEVVTRTRFDGGGRLTGKNVDSGDLKGVDPRVGEVIRGLGDRINYNLIAATVAQIDEELRGEEGGILIFLPGTLEITRCLEAIGYLPKRFYTLPLHATLLPNEQRRVFPPAPRGFRKVIAATNVAETSITIEDVVAVIDTGRVKETSYDPENNIVKLLETWASRAACKQRRGRAGRVAAGTCWKLYTRNAEETKMQERPEPELKRVPLEQTCLGVKHMGVKDVRAFLASALSPPETLAVSGALRLLERMGAIADDELTALGKHLAMIPADLRCSKLMVYGAIFGCLDAAVTIASVLTTKSPFLSAVDRREKSKAARVAFGKGNGDLLADCRAYEEWSDLRKTAAIREVRLWCEEHCLNYNALMDVASNRSQYIDSLKDIGFLPMDYYPGSESDSVYNHNGANSALIRGLIAGAFSPQIVSIRMPEQRFASSSVGAVAVDPESRMVKYYTEDKQRVFIFPGSTLFDASSFVGDARFLGYGSKTVSARAGAEENGKIFLRDVTPINSYSVLLFGGDLAVDTMGRGITVDGWLKLRGWGRIGTLVSQLRMMLDRLLETKIDDPDMDLRGNEVVACVRKLIEGNGN